MNTGRFFSLILLLIFTFSVAYSQEENKDIRKGNEYYENGDYEKALLKYNDAKGINDRSFIATFNTADVLYKQGNLDSALFEYNVALNKTEEKKQSSSVYHNMGNCFLDQQKFSEAVSAYKQALRNNPLSEESRYNLAYAQEKLKDQQNQQQQNQDQNNDQENKDDENKDQDKKDKENKDKKDDKKDQDKKNEKDQKDKKDQQKNKDKKDQDKQKQEPQKQQISKEAAERILEALENDEKKVQEKVQKAEAEKMERRVIEKDW